MRNMIKALLVATLIVPTLAMANITGSRHDLTTNANGQRVYNSAAGSALCSYCHTPHKAAATQLLWNRNYTANAGWTSLNTTNGTVLPASAAIQAPSRACLSCHDGSNVLGSLINLNGGPALITTWLGANVTGAATGGQLAAGTIDNLGTNLNGNHPISVPYGGAGITYQTIVSKAATADFQGVGSGASCTGSTFCAGGATNGKLIPLFGASTTTVGVECTSCHDPHYTANGFFLRVTNNASALCIACHNK